MQERAWRTGPLGRVAAALATAALSVPVAGAATLEENGFKLYGDFRLRLENDWDSQQADGTEREDRLRARIRARLGIDYSPGEHFTAGARLRSGSDLSQQSPHITILDFDDNDTGDADFNLDRWFLEAEGGGFRGWAGRNSAPFWKQNEIFWDDDVTPAGLAAGYRTDPGEETSLFLNSAYLSLPAGIQDFSGKMVLGQAVLETRPGDLEITVAAGFYAIDADPNDADGTILERGNGSRDYSIWIGSGRVRVPLGPRTLTLGIDTMRNIEDYREDDPDPFTAANRDETKGHVVQIGYGGTRQQGDWLAAWYYARIETFAVNSSYSQDDWMRWGSATQTRSSDFKGHELRFAYALLDRLNLVARLYLVEGITTGEDGKRLRLDLNYRF